MKLLLLPLLAALAFPTAANAETYWLILSIHRANPIALEKIEMESMKQCEEQAAIWLASRSIKSGPRGRGYQCLRGK